MSLLFSSLAAIAMVAVLVVLIRGLINMMRGGSPQRSNQLMQARVVLQFVAILLLATIFIIQRAG